MSKYDIFISYRRDNGAQYARTLQLMLEKRGYRVFLDYDELIDEEFSPKIIEAINEAPIYIIVLTKGSLDRCANEGDWVGKELETAIKANKKIIPVDPDRTFDGVPTDIPEIIRKVVGGLQHSEISFGQSLNVTVDLMVNNRIRPYLRKRSKRVFLAVTVFIAAAVVAGVSFYYYKICQIERLKESVTLFGENVGWSEKVSEAQLLAVDEIFRSMKIIPGGEFMQGAVPAPDGSYDETVDIDLETPAFMTEVGSFGISAFEITVGQWNAIMDDDRAGDSSLPVGSVTFNQAKEFAERLSNLTTKQFRLPTETEWEYAARGGNEPEGFIYAGSDNPDEVAWYGSNSGARSHSDLPKTATINDLFNMSGNVSEWCDTPFKPYNSEVSIGNGSEMTVRGGNYDSDPYELTVTHREPALPDTSIPTLGFRIVIDR